MSCEYRRNGICSVCASKTLCTFSSSSCPIKEQRDEAIREDEECEARLKEEEAIGKKGGSK